MILYIFALCAVSFFKGLHVSAAGETVNRSITWSVEGVQEYTLQNPLEVSQGDTIRFLCVNRYSNVFYLVSEEQYTNCNGSADSFTFLGPCFTNNASSNKVISLAVSENADVLSIATQFESGQPYYFASFSQNNTTLSSFSETTVTGGECALGLRMAIMVRSSTTSSESPSNTPSDPESPSNMPSDPGTGGLGRQLSTTDYIIIAVVPTVLLIALALALCCICCLCRHRFCKNKNKGEKNAPEVVTDGEKGVYRPTQTTSTVCNGSSSKNGVKKHTNLEEDNKRNNRQKKTAPTSTNNELKKHGGLDADKKGTNNENKKPTQKPQGSNNLKPQKPPKTGNTEEDDRSRNNGREKTAPSPTNKRRGGLVADKKGTDNENKKPAQKPQGSSNLKSQKPPKIGGNTEKPGGGNKVTPEPLNGQNKPSPRCSSFSTAKNERAGTSSNQATGKGGHRPTYTSGVGERRKAPPRPSPNYKKEPKIQTNSAHDVDVNRSITPNSQSSHQNVDATVSLPIDTKAKQQKAVSVRFKNTKKV